MTRLLLLANLAATLYMTGVIWFVQIVHYPLFALIGPREFPAYEAQHSARTTLVVALPMLLEAFTAAALVLVAPMRVPRLLLVAALLLVGLIWLSTFFLQVPQHSRLTQAFDLDAIRFLTRSNWLRAAAWSLRALFMLYAVSRHLYKQ